MNDGPITDRGERFALHVFGKQAIVPAASAAARAVFEACGGAVGWKSWVVPNGKMITIALQVLAKRVDDDPTTPAEEIYTDLRAFPGFIGPHESWADAPMQVRGAYETFRAVYLQLWVIVRTHDDRMARALPPRPLPRLVHCGAIEDTDAARSGLQDGRRNIVRLPDREPVDGDGAA